MKLFTVGPVQMQKDILDIGIQQIPYFRTEEFSDILFEIDRMLKTLLQSDNGNLLISSSGTGAMEAAITNLFNSQDKLLIVNGGSFGQRFVEICQKYNFNYHEIKLSFGEKLTDQHLIEYLHQNFSGFLINHHETSTGVLYDLKLVSDFCKNNNITLVVDAISSFLSDLGKLDNLSTDILIFSSHKALSLMPGLSIINFSEKAKMLISQNESKTYYFDLQKAIQNSLRGQTPFTPSISIIYQLHRRLELLIQRGGLEVELNKVTKIAEYFRKSIADLPVYIPHYNLSNCLTPIMFKSNSVDAYNIFEILRNEYELVVNPCGGELKNKMLRIGHIGNLTISDIDLLLDALRDLERKRII